VKYFFDLVIYYYQDKIVASHLYISFLYSTRVHV